jgi:hypothetical protein
LKGRWHGRRRALAEKLGVAFVSKYDEVLRRVKELRERGMKWREVAREMGVSERRVDGYRRGLRRREKNGVQAEESAAMAKVGDSEAR